MSASHPVPGLATWDDVAGLPEGTRTEILEGTVTVSPSPLPRHGFAQMALAGRIGVPFGAEDEPGGWWIIVAPDVELARHEVVEPDLAGWRRERMPEFPEDRPIRLVPDWTCEILSPSNRRTDLITKANLYLRAGVAFYWIVDPEERTLQALRRHGDGEQTSWLVLGTWSEGDAVAVAPFEAVTLDVGRLFPRAARAEPA